MLYPIGRQDLEDIRRGGYVYVDHIQVGIYWEILRPGPPEAVRQESADFNDGGIFPREKGTL